MSLLTNLLNAIDDVFTSHPPEIVEAAAIRIAARQSAGACEADRKQQGLTVWRNRICRVLEDVGSCFGIHHEKLSAYLGIQSLPCAFFQDPITVWLFFRRVLLRSGMAFYPASDRLGGRFVVERWGLYIDGRGVKCGDAPKLDRCVWDTSACQEAAVPTGVYRSASRPGPSCRPQGTAFA